MWTRSPAVLESLKYEEMFIPWHPQTSSHLNSKISKLLPLSLNYVRFRTSAKMRKFVRSNWIVQCVDRVGGKCGRLSYFCRLESTESQKCQPWLHDVETPKYIIIESVLFSSFNNWIPTNTISSFMSGYVLSQKGPIEGHNTRCVCINCSLAEKQRAGYAF